jgi:hypothetical protein
MVRVLCLSFFGNRSVLVFVGAVNEVGYSNVLRQNVYATTVDGNTIHYFFWPGQDLLSINKPIELYTKYRGAFENIRERRGYGKRNAMYGLPSDALAVARLERNFSDREDATNDLRMIAEDDAKKGTNGLSRQFVFLRYEWSILLAGEGTLSGEQIVALRRISWLASVLGDIVDSAVPVEPSLENAITEWVASVVLRESTLYDDVMQVINETFEALKSEIIEEVLYQVRNKMPLLMDTNLYCPIAQNLIEDLCLKHCEIKSKGMLLEAFITSGLESMKEIRRCAAGSDRDRLAFISREPEGTLLCGNSQEILGKVSRTAAFFVQHTTFSKGILTAVSALKSTMSCAPSFVEVPIGQSTFMAKMRSEAYHIQDANIAALSSIPVDASTASSECEVNVEWYIYWQVVWIVHCFAEHFVPDYDLECLCRELGVDLIPARFVTERGVRHYSTISFDDVLRKQGAKKSQRKSRPMKERKKKALSGKDGSPTPPKNPTISSRPPAKLVYEGPPTTRFPIDGEDWPFGWMQRTYERASGATKGHQDDYWFPPDNRKLRSSKDIIRYLAKLH